jgi:hypothetical protein
MSRRALDLEQKDEKGNTPNPSTHSVNRYSLVLSTMTVIKEINLAENETNTLMSIGPENSEDRVRNVDYYQLVPILPYTIAASGSDDVDRANLMLGRVREKRSRVLISGEEHQSWLLQRSPKRSVCEQR